MAIQRDVPSFLSTAHKIPRYFLSLDLATLPAKSNICHRTGMAQWQKCGQQTWDFSPFYCFFTNILSSHGLGLQWRGLAATGSGNESWVLHLELVCWNKVVPSIHKTEETWVNFYLVFKLNSCPWICHTFSDKLNSQDDHANKKELRNSVYLRDDGRKYDW